MSAPINDSESTGKDLFRHAWSYAQKLDRAYKNGGDVFHPDLIAIRTKIKEKCEQILVLSCSHRRKSEELLWRKVFYEVISYCKKYKLFDPAHPLHSSCHTHLMTACMFYQNQLQWLPEHYGWDIMNSNSIQLEEGASANKDLQWLLEACQRCLVYLGDIARYQIDLGGTSQEAAMYYQQAIALDPSNGAPFNQLAVLAESKQLTLEAVYYYMRSITSLHPFPVSEANLKRLFDRNAKTLHSMVDAGVRKTEPDLKLFHWQSLQSSIVQLQCEFHSATRTSSSDIPLLCAKIMTNLEECLQADWVEINSASSLTPKTLTNPDSRDVWSGNGSISLLLPSKTVVEVCALTVLPAYNLRLQGSKETLPSSAFALSVFSLLLHFAYKQLVSLSHSVGQQHTAQEDPLHQTDMLPGEEEHTMLELLTKHDTSTHHVTSAADTVCKPADITDCLATSSPTGTTSSIITATSTTSSSVTKTPPIVITHPVKKAGAGKLYGKGGEGGGGGGGGGREDRLRVKTKQASHQTRSRRRRRRRRKWNEGLSESSDESSSEESSSEDSMGVLEDEEQEKVEEEDKIESLSISSSSDTSEEDDDKKPTLSPPPLRSPRLPSSPSSGVSRPRRNIQLAANFSGIPPDSPNPVSEATNRTPDQPPSKTLSHDLLHLSLESHDQSGDDRQLAKLYQDTTDQVTVHNACVVVARCPLLGGIKVLTDWLQCYPTVIATYAKSSATSIWSRLADLLNFMPTADALKKTGLIEVNCKDISEWNQPVALFEDSFLHGFAPLLRKQQTLTFPSALECLNNELVHPQVQGVILILSLIKFGHFVANSKTTPDFEFDSSTGRFMGPAQREREAARAAAELKQKQEREAWANRTKLMKAMAEQKLQLEVSALAKTKAQKEGALFTPYLIPDASTLCTSLHLIKKLLKTEKFIIVIAQSVIENLDQMKKGKDSYTAREAIKFLEKELRSGNRFVRAQKPEETAQPGRRKPHKQELSVWLFSCLVDCAVFFTTNPPAGCDSGGGALATLLLPHNIVTAVEYGPSSRHHHGNRSSKQADPEVLELAVMARQSGVEVETLVHFYKRWNRQC